MKIQKLIKMLFLVFAINIAVGMLIKRTNTAANVDIPSFHKITDKEYNYICLVNGVIIDSKDGIVRFLPVPLYNPDRPFINVSIFHNLSSLQTRNKVDKLINNNYKNSEATLLILRKNVNNENKLIFMGAIKSEGKILYQTKI